MRRFLVPALVAVVVVVAGAAIYLRSSPTSTLLSDAAQAQTRSTPAPGAAAADDSKAGASSSELLAAGPLEDRVLGKADAPVTIVEYASLTCPHCAAFHEETFPQLKAKYIDAGKVRFIFREFPLDNYATAGFMIARCAEADKYFPIVDAFFKQQRNLMGAPDPYVWMQGFAKQVGFTQETLEGCLTNQPLMDAVLATRQRASEKFGVNSTPSFFINGKISRGAMSMQELEKEIEPLLRS
jgi:protein-disulfide isomerase